MFDALLNFFRQSYQDVVCGFVAKVSIAGFSVLGFSAAGIWGSQAQALFLLVCMDFGCGLAQAWRKDCFSWRRFKGGLAKFVRYGLAVSAAALFDMALNLQVRHASGFDSSRVLDFRGVMTCFLCACELLSILSHLQSMGMTMPKGLMSRLENIRDAKTCTPKREDPR